MVHTGHMNTYRIFLRGLALLVVVCVSMVIVMNDVNEDREPFEFVQVER